MKTKSFFLKNEIVDFLTKKGFEEVMWEDDVNSITFYNPNCNYNSTLINQYSTDISKIIISNGYDDDDFIISGSSIEFPRDYEDR